MIKKNKKNTLLLNYNDKINLFKYKIFIFSIIIIILTFFLFIQLYYLQVICHKYYKTSSEKNCIKVISIFPNRGLIFDRNGIPIVFNQKVYQLYIFPKKVKNFEKTIKKLEKVIFLNEKEIKKIRRKFFSCLENKSFFLIKTLFSEKEIAEFSVNRHSFPELELKINQIRYYPYKSDLAPVTGYVSKSNFQNFSLINNLNLIEEHEKNYYSGKLGVERFYNDILCGEEGYKRVEVNNKGKIIKEIENKKPKSGNDIYLTIDLNLQLKIKNLLKDSKAAVIVANPKNGDILALVSTPSYDPNLFINGISKENYHFLKNNLDYPFLNRATQGIYPPASTAKPFIGIAGLSENIISEYYQIFDPGYWKLPNSNKYYRDWKRNGHGRIDLIKAIVESSDTFFYDLSYKMGINVLSNWMKKFGYGKYTGIDIKEENLGVMPNEKWKNKKYKLPWYIGDTISVGIGQGYWVATPIQMINALIILINNGNSKVPHLLNFLKSEDKIYYYSQKNKKENFEIVQSKFWNLIKNGMYGVSNYPNGTAYKSFFDTYQYKAAIKSGTAQIISYEKHESNKIINKNFKDHKLMIGYAPYEDPKVSIVIVLENGGNGVTIGEIARKIFDYIIVNNINF